MRSWFCLISVICLSVALALWALGMQPRRPIWVDYACIAALALTVVTSVVSLVRRERWRAASSFAMGVSLSSVFWVFSAIEAAVNQFK